MAKIAIMGHGTLGSGLAEVARVNAESIAAKVGEAIEVKYILDIRDFPDSPYADRFIKDFSIIENDPEVEVVVETIGGSKIAMEFTRRALLAGKHVVTANKEMVATYGKELLAIAKEKNVNYLFEASVGGAIPLLRPLYQCLAGNQIEEIAGILNGTTNYILTRMVEGGVSFETALKEAQAKGYAEADPTADVAGIDAGRKICILADLAWGKEVPPAKVSMEGISKVDLQDVDIAAAAGYKVKLLGHAIRMEGGKVAAYVAPHLVSKEKLLASVDDVFNAVMIKGNAVDEVMFYGRGAGKPTASAIMGDIIDAVAHRDVRRDLGWTEEAELADANEIPMKWYLRGEFSADSVENAEKVAENAVITAPLTKAQAQAQAEKLGAVAMLRVL